MNEKPMTASEMGSKGAKAGWAKLTPEERSERARNAGKKGGWPKGRPRNVEEINKMKEELTKKLTNNS